MARTGQITHYVLGRETIHGFACFHFFLIFFFPIYHSTMCDSIFSFPSFSPVVISFIPAFISPRSC